MSDIRDKKTGKTYDAKFNIYNEGREHEGHHRTYLARNIGGIFESGSTKEALQKREMIGFFGHGRRQFAKKVKIQEVENITLPDGKVMIVENIPCSVTVNLDFNPDTGDVNHTQELLATDPGIIVEGLINSKVGGWSWAMEGDDGGALRPTIASHIRGFDYVFQPGFHANRNYILESIAAGGETMAETMGQIYESVSNSGVSEDKAKSFIDHWMATEIMWARELEQRLIDASIYESGVVYERDEALAEIETIKNASDARKAMILECVKDSVVAVPENVIEAMIAMSSPDDWAKVAGFFESAAKTGIGGLPIGPDRMQPLIDDTRPGAVNRGTNRQRSTPPSYGSAHAGIPQQVFPGSGSLKTWHN